MDKKTVNNLAFTAAGVMVGVFAIGWIFATFDDVAFIQKARGGFDTGFL